jgi:DNA-binding response OmpR family regulator
MRVLVVEDEKKVAGFIRKGLAEQSYSGQRARKYEKMVSPLRSF